jgi:tetratricopeptide (TPR) repeat protein
VTDLVPSTLAPGPVPAIWGGVPAQNKNFTGRDGILNVLHDALSSEVTAVLPHALQGMGGVGKTAVAVEYAYRYRNEYELVWWVPADQPALVQASLAQLAASLGLPPATATGIGIEGAAAATLNALRKGEPYKRWLLIFDNADQPEDLNDILPRGPGDVLITSRNPRWESVVQTVQVDVFNRTESIAFLNKRVPSALSEADAAALASELGDLPLALEQAGALQAGTGISVEEYLELLKEQVSAILSEGKSPDYPMSMTAAWKLSVRTLAQRQPEAVTLLRCCAFFGAEPIPRGLLPRGAQGVPGSPLGELLSDPIKLARSIRELGRFALVRIDGRTIVIHRLIQALQRAELTPEEQDSFREQAHLIISAGAPKNPEDNQQWPRYTELIAHVQSTELELSRHSEARRFALDVVRYLYNSGNLESARQFSKRYIEAWQANTDEKDPQLLLAQQHLGNVLRAMGRYESAFEIDRKTLARAQQSLGEEHPLTLAQTSSYTADLRGNGDFAEALRIDVEALERHRRVLGLDDARTLRVSNNLAVDYGLNSRYPEARDLHQETYTRRLDAADIPATELLSSWGGLARALRLCGAYGEARDVGQDAYDYGLSELGPDHPRTLETAIDLSVALRRTGGNYDESLELAADVLELSRRRFGTSAPLTLAATLSFTNIRRATNQASAAMGVALETMEHYRAIYGDTHPYYFGCMGNVATLYRVNNDLVKAVETDEIALVGLKDRLGADHHYALTVAVNLASDYAELGNPARAREIGEDTMPRLRTVLGQDHPLTLACAANMVPDLRATGAEAEADHLLADTIRRFQQTLGDDHTDTIAAAEGRRLDPDFDAPQI